MTDYDPRILPGASAFLAQRRYLVAVLAFGIATITVFVVVCVNDHALNKSDLPGGLVVFLLFGSYFVIALIGVAVCLILFAFARRRKLAELAAGYTTLLSQFDQVDGIDWKTGAVVRPAKPRVVRSGASEAFTSGIELGSLNSGVSGIQAMLRMRRTLAWSIVSLVVAVVSLTLAFTELGDSDLFAPILVIVGSFAAVGAFLFPTYAISLGPPRFNREFLDRHFADDRVLATQTVGTFSDIVSELLPPDVPSLADARPRLTCYLVFEKGRLVVYSRKQRELIPFLVIPKSRVVSTRMDVNSQGRASIPIIILSVQKDDGTATDASLQFLPIASVRRDRVSKELTADNDWVAAWAKGDAA